MFPLDTLTFITVHNEEAIKLWFEDSRIKLNFIHPYPTFKTSDLETVVFPDAGAEKRFKHLVNGSYLVAEKSRDINQEHSKILKYELLNPFKIDVTKIESVIVIDDMSDGGGTFKLLSSELDKIGNFKKTLYLTHNIQEKGILSLTDFYDDIYACNTYSELPKHDKIHILKKVEDMV